MDSTLPAMSSGEFWDEVNGPGLRGPGSEIQFDHGTVGDLGPLGVFVAVDVVPAPPLVARAFGVALGRVFPIFLTALMA